MEIVNTLNTVNAALDIAILVLLVAISYRTNKRFKQVDEELSFIYDAIDNLEDHVRQEKLKAYIAKTKKK